MLMASNSDANTPHPPSSNVPHRPLERHCLLTLNILLLGQTKVALKLLFVSCHMKIIFLVITSSRIHISCGENKVVITGPVTEVYQHIYDTGTSCGH